MKPELKFEEVNGETEAFLSGELTIRYKKEMKSIFQKMAEKKPVAVTVKSPDQVDLSFLQLWWSFIRELHTGGKAIRITSVLPQSEEQLLKRLNLLNLLQ